jgi:tRNA pseudouridine38-40 synthase
MVRALVATMLKMGRGKLTVKELEEIIASRDCTKATFAAPARGLFLKAVHFPEGYFEQQKKLAG